MKRSQPCGKQKRVTYQEESTACEKPQHKKDPDI